MFGPNTDIEVNIKTDFSHRDIKFIKLFKDLSKLLLNKAKLDGYEYDVIFMGGSGTLAIESLFWSSTKNIQVTGPKGRQLTDGVHRSEGRGVRRQAEGDHRQGFETISHVGRRADALPVDKARHVVRGHRRLRAEGPRSAHQHAGTRRE